ncbi:photoreceptor-specific nuclear receptor-like [Schistocerca piceifrons]|uniref:photoreceptor-specific nuclear receptor-like n=1 Tax=Schistocerca piceifrons TaxID=274613 RepID=UPI001F5E9D7B|nr:photoreceptor-specific nuclear receptor-like [Schistocerca piceifrons]
MHFVLVQQRSGTPATPRVAGVGASSSSGGGGGGGGGEARRGRRATPPRRCAVCGDRAYSLHFGGLSCDSCKAFFRRSVQSRACLTFRCPHSRPCLVTVTSRRCCQACRYAKCLAAGMEPGWVLSEQERHQKVAKKCAESPTQDNKCGAARKREVCQQTQNAAELPKHLSPAELHDLNAIISAFRRACENCTAQNQAKDATGRVIEATNFPYHLTMPTNGEIAHNSEINSCFLDNKCETVIDEGNGKTENVEDDLNFLEHLFVQPETQVLDTQHPLPTEQGCTPQWSSASEFQWNTPVHNNGPINTCMEVTSGYGETEGMQQLYTCPTTYLPDVY